MERNEHKSLCDLTQHLLYIPMAKKLSFKFIEY